MHMSKSAHAKDAVLEILKKIQGSLADLRNGQVDMRRDIHDLKSSNARTLGMIGAITTPALC
jgi:hypothetical protein